MNHPHDPVAICEACGLTFTYEYPPIPLRHFDWMVWADPEDSYLGNGRTKQEAAWDAMWNLDERYV